MQTRITAPEDSHTHTKLSLAQAEVQRVKYEDLDIHELYFCRSIVLSEKCRLVLRKLPFPAASATGSQKSCES